SWGLGTSVGLGPFGSYGGALGAYQTDFFGGPAFGGPPNDIGVFAFGGYFDIPGVHSPSFALGADVVEQMTFTLVSVSKLLESTESFVIQRRWSDSPRSHRCGRLRTERNTIVIT